MYSEKAREIIKDFDDETIELFRKLENGIKVKGIIIESTGITYDNDPGFRIKFKFLDLNGKEIIDQTYSSIHYPSIEEWEKYSEENKVGAEILVIYINNDPLISEICTDINSFRDDRYKTLFEQYEMIKNRGIRGR
jgi:hypothetical protein